MSRWIDELRRRLGGSVTIDADLGERTTYRVGGRATLVDVADIDALRAVGAVIAAHGVPTVVIGNGSNMLVADRGFDGLAIALGESFASIEIARPDGAVVTVDAGGRAMLPQVARQTVAAGCTGFAWAVGVPGTIGGAVRMNAGGHGSDMAAVTRGVRVFDLQTGEDGAVSADDLAFGYRTSAIAPHHVVVSATLELSVGDVAEGERELSSIVSWRRANQPGGHNAGSVFTNPPGDSAGRLIDASGCKALRVGTAEVSAKHANFVQVDAGGSADDVFALMIEVRDRVAAATGVRLHPETRMVGFDSSAFDDAGMPT